MQIQVDSAVWQQGHAELRLHHYAVHFLRRRWQRKQGAYRSRFAACVTHSRRQVQKFEAEGLPDESFKAARNAWSLASVLLAQRVRTVLEQGPLALALALVAAAS